MEDWAVERGSEEGLVRIRNKASGMFISYNGDAIPMNPVVVLPQPRDWVLTAGQASGTYYITAFSDGGSDPVDLVLSPSPLPIFPPRTALLPKKLETNQTWKFQPAN
ncbi:hypothetical protein HWV62_15243 [Athelia sp. TMB]|nr:hypothetical protein HWV62_15243 [Athelia sp. TMB]